MISCVGSSQRTDNAFPHGDKAGAPTRSRCAARSAPGSLARSGSATWRCRSSWMVSVSSSTWSSTSTPAPAPSSACRCATRRTAKTVIEAFDSGIATTGARPLALLLDNKPCNHSPVVDAALGDTLRMRATPEKPQNKAHVEGAFGLFSSAAAARHRHEPDAARHRARLPRRRRRPLGAHDQPSPTQRSRWSIARRPVRRCSDAGADRAGQARVAPRDHDARSRRAGRARPGAAPRVFALLDESFSRLGLEDPERHVRVAIARYPLDAIVGGVSTFDAKRSARTLPDGVDARYLLGIVRNIADRGRAVCRRNPVPQSRRAARSLPRPPAGRA